MPRVGVSITKSISFRGVAQEFSNTYYYESATAVDNTTGISLIDAIVALEKPMHASTVTFVRGRCWTAGGSPSSNNMLAQKSLSGTGTHAASPSTAADRERAFLVRIRAGQDSKGRPVYLRKWWHLDIGAVGGSSVTNAQLQNVAQLDSTQKGALEAWFNAFKTVTASGGPYVLTAESGRDFDGATQAHSYLEHHQLGDMWRG